jgi:hypothetical protein
MKIGSSFGFCTHGSIRRIISLSPSIRLIRSTFVGAMSGEVDKKIIFLQRDDEESNNSKNLIEEDDEESNNRKVKK